MAVAVSFALYLLGVFCNNPHYSATLHRAYRSAKDFNKYRYFSVYVTVLLFLTVVRSPDQLKSRIEPKSGSNKRR